MFVIEGKPNVKPLNPVCAPLLPDNRVPKARLYKKSQNMLFNTAIKKAFVDEQNRLRKEKIVLL